MKLTMPSDSWGETFRNTLERLRMRDVKCNIMLRPRNLGLRFFTIFSVLISEWWITPVLDLFNQLGGI